jgi:hypothetical protein
MLTKLAEATRRLCANLVLFSSIILTVWLPGNVLANYLTYYVDTEDEVLRSIRVGSLFEGIFGPIYVPAMIYALSKIKEGQRPRYFEAMAVGFRNWARLFAVRFLAGLLIGLGFIALVVPGIVLSVRYALLDSVVVLEGARADEARRRSTELTIGIRWQIFWVWILTRRAACSAHPLCGKKSPPPPAGRRRRASSPTRCAASDLSSASMA